MDIIISANVESPEKERYVDKKVLFCVFLITLSPKINYVYKNKNIVINIHTVIGSTGICNIKQIGLRQLEKRYILILPYFKLFFSIDTIRQVKNINT